jgi:hypothetical protein
MDATTLLITV